MKFKTGIFIAVIFVLFSLNKGSCETVKNLYLKLDNSYLLVFGEKIITYKISNNNAVKVEYLTDIFTDKQELLIKPLKNTNTTLFIQTNSSTYNYNLSFSDIDKSADNSDLIEIDIPPVLPEDSVNLELDEPPVFKKQSEDK